MPPTGYAGMTRSCIQLQLAALSAACAAGISTAGLAQVVTQGIAQSKVSSQPSGTGDLAEITVTAQRRAENPQNVPMSVEAFSEERLKTMALSSVTDLGLVTPGLIAADEFGYFQPHLRGVGTTAASASVENPVAVYVDGVYYGSQAGSILLLTEGIDHVEVDRGPQGTLFGRNATAGLIQIVTKDPEPTFDGTVNLTAGNYNTFGVSTYLTGAVTPYLSSNVSLNFQDQGTGYGRNYFTGLDVNKTQDLVIRQKNLIKPSPHDKVLVAFDYAQDHSSPVLIPAPGTTPLGGVPYTGSRWSADGYYQPLVKNEQGSASLKVEHDFGFASLESVSAYLQNRLYSALDGTFVTNYAYALNIPLWDLNRQITQEFALRSHDGSAATWTTGIYYYQDTAEYAPVYLEGGYIAPLTYLYNYSRARNWSAALFGQISKQLFDGTTITLGARETHEARKFAGYQEAAYPATILAAGAAKQESSTPTWRAALDHKLTRDTLVYVSYSRGYKTGGYNDLVPVVTYQPETLDAYEAGTKITIAGHLRANLAAFYYNYRNLQSVGYPAGSETISNAPRASISGVDLDIQAALFGSCSVSFGLEALRAIYKDFPAAQLSTPLPGGGSALSLFNASGKQLPLAPKWSGDVAPQCTFSWGSTGAKVALAATYSYNSGFYYEPDNRFRQGPVSLLSASAAWTSSLDSYTVRIWGKNLTDKAYTTAMYAQENADYAKYAPPRTYGITITRRF